MQYLGLNRDEDIQNGNCNTINKKVERLHTLNNDENTTNTITRGSTNF